MSQATSLIHASLSKRYEQRSYQQHKMLINALALLFPTLTPKKIKLITFFLELRESNEIQPDEYSVNSFIITFSASNPQQSQQMRILGKKVVAIREGDFAAVLDYEKYLNAELLGDTSIEKQLGFWETSEYFCSMPKKKFIELIRKAKVLVFTEGQAVYNQGQMITQRESGSGIYVIRSGEFGCYHNARKDIQTSHFSSGHIFGALELMNHGEFRATTIRCKTTSAIVYNFTEKVFNQLIRHYCENVIYQRQGKLMKFVSVGQMEKSKSVSFSHNMRDSKILRSQETTSSFKNSVQKDKHLEENQFRAFPSIRLEQIRQTATTSFYKSTLRESQRLESQALKRTTYLSLKKQGPLKNYPLPAQRSNFLTSEFRDLDKIFQKRAPCLLITENPSEKPTHGVWKRDMMSSFYRQTIYNSLKCGQPQQ